MEQNDLIWHTANGDRIPFDKIDHQHLSNIIWYYRLIVRCEPHLEVLNLLKSKFNNQHLLFKPLPIKGELRELFNNGYLKNDGWIVYNNKIIGSVHHIHNWRELIEIY